MKSFIKKISVAVCTAAISLIITTANVSAVVTPPPIQAGGAPVVSEAVEVNTDNNTREEEPAEVESSQSMVQTSVNATEAKKGFTHWNAFLWFLLSVIVNFVISCWVGNRFYRLARKSTQTSNEIRALRKDIEEKFASTLNDIEDPSIEVMNRNEDYSRTDEGIVMPSHRQRVEMNEEENERMRKWDERRVSRRIASREEEQPVDTEEEELYEERPVRRAYQPTRRLSGIEFEDEEYAEEAYEEPVKKGTFSKATNKAKDFLSNVFPFED